MYKGKFVSAIIAAAGMSNRMGSRINKQFIAINNKPILAHALDKFENCKYIDEIIVVAKEEEIEYIKKEIISRYRFNKVNKIVRGGRERQDSVYNGLFALDEMAEIVISHDGARPFVKADNILDSIKGAYKYGACVIGVPVKDTIKVVSNDKTVDHTPERSHLWAAQTPQTFRKDIIKNAYKNAIIDGFKGTDDASIVERNNIDVKLILGSYENIKITTPEDLIIAESMFKDKESIIRKRDILFQSR